MRMCLPSTLGVTQEPVICVKVYSVVLTQIYNFTPVCFNYVVAGTFSFDVDMTYTEPNIG